MIEIMRPSIPREVENTLLKVRIKADDCIKDGVWWDVIDTLSEASGCVVTRKWFNESPENREEFILAFLFSYDLIEEESD